MPIYVHGLQVALFGIKQMHWTMVSFHAERDRSSRTRAKDRKGQLKAKRGKIK
jgi:hypothetical protein